MMRSYTKTINSFNEINSFDFFRELTEKIKMEIEEKGKEYILGVDEEEFKNYLINKFKLEPLTIDYNSETIDEPSVSKEWFVDRIYGEKYQSDVYNFTVRYNYTGSEVLFKIKPSAWRMTSLEISVYEPRKIVSFNFKLYKKDPDEFARKKGEYQSRAFANLKSVNQEVENWMQSLQKKVNSIFNQTKSKYLETV